MIIHWPLFIGSHSACSPHHLLSMLGSHFSGWKCSLPVNYFTWTPPDNKRHRKPHGHFSFNSCQYSHDSFMLCFLPHALGHPYHTMRDTWNWNPTLRKSSAMLHRGQWSKSFDLSSETKWYPTTTHHIYHNFYFCIANRCDNAPHAANKIDRIKRTSWRRISMRE